MAMKIFILGNPDLEGDNVAVRLMPSLKKQFPKIEFKHIDPLEGFGENLICRISDDRRIYDKKESGGNDQITIIDAVKGISEVEKFDDLAQFVSAHKRLTMHDFDLYDELMLLKKMESRAQTCHFCKQKSRDEHPAPEDHTLNKHSHGLLGAGLPKIAIIGLPWGVSEKDILNDLITAIQAI